MVTIRCYCLLARIGDCGASGEPVIVGVGEGWAHDDTNVNLGIVGVGRSIISQLCAVDFGGILLDWVVYCVVRSGIVLALRNRLWV